MFMLCQLLVPILIIFGKYCFNLCISVSLPKKSNKNRSLTFYFQMLNQLHVLEKQFTPNELSSPNKRHNEPRAAHKFCPTRYTKRWPQQSSALTFHYLMAQTSPDLHPDPSQPSLDFWKTSQRQEQLARNTSHRMWAHYSRLKVTASLPF